MVKKKRKEKVRRYIQFKPLTKNQMYSTKMAELEFSDFSEVFST